MDLLPMYTSFDNRQISHNSFWYFLSCSANLPIHTYSSYRGVRTLVIHTVHHGLHGRASGEIVFAERRLVWPWRLDMRVAAFYLTHHFQSAADQSWASRIPRTRDSLLEIPPYGPVNSLSTADLMDPPSNPPWVVDNLHRCR